MNINTSKILLGISIAAYTYCSWDHLSSAKKDDSGPAKPAQLTQAMVNHQEVLALGRDAFESVAIDRGDPNADALAQAISNSRAGTSTAGAAGAAGVSALSALALQGIFMTPSGHAALINGTPVGEGESATIIGGPKVFVRKIGDDYAVVEAWGQTKILKLNDPAAAAQAAAPAASAGSPAPASSYTPPRAPANTSSGSAPVNHGGGTDPYAGHRTGHH